MPQTVIDLNCLYRYNSYTGWSPLRAIQRGHAASAGVRARVAFEAGTKAARTGVITAKVASDDFKSARIARCNLQQCSGPLTSCCGLVGVLGANNRTQSE